MKLLFKYLLFSWTRAGFKGALKVLKSEPENGLAIRAQ